MFAWSGWGIVRPWSTGFTVWSYRTDDTLNEVTAEGYFDAIRMLGCVDQEDWIIGFAAFERPIELVVMDTQPQIVVGSLHEWFDSRCGPAPPQMPH